MPFWYYATDRNYSATKVKFYHCDSVDELGSLIAEFIYSLRNSEILLTKLVEGADHFNFFGARKVIIKLSEQKFTRRS